MFMHAFHHICVCHAVFMSDVDAVLLVIMFCHPVLFVVNDGWMHGWMDDGWMCVCESCRLIYSYQYVFIDIRAVLFSGCVMVKVSYLYITSHLDQHSMKSLFSMKRFFVPKILTMSQCKYDISPYHPSYHPSTAQPPTSMNMSELPVMVVHQLYAVCHICCARDAVLMLLTHVMSIHLSCAFILSCTIDIHTHIHPPIHPSIRMPCMPYVCVLVCWLVTNVI